MVTITSVSEHSYASAAGIRERDVLCSVNGHEIRDVLDYRFYLTDCRVTLKLLRGEEEILVTFHKGEHDDIGLTFETPLMDKKHSCANGCVFCFIDQMPKGLRESLYFKDDDDRLSFLHGNYVTLTNLKDQDIDRLIEMHLSPINVSVHTTNPELRVRMMKNRRAGEVLSYLRRLADAGIALCAQIVLCKGYNDGEELDRSMRDLLTYYPALRSCAIVPVGLTKFREGLCPLTLFSPEECAAVIRQVDRMGDECRRQYGTRLFWCSDEFYIRAGLPLPGDDYYEDYSQLENGVGMMTSLASEFDLELSLGQDLLAAAKTPRRVSLATGAAAYEGIQALCGKLTSRVPGLNVKVCKIENHFFGETVTVAGLLTGTDLAEQLAGQDLGDELLIPAAMCRADEEIFLDGYTPRWLSEKLGVPVTPCKSDGYELLCALLGVKEPEPECGKDQR